MTSKDGGTIFTGPNRVDTLYDVNEPRGVNGLDRLQRPWSGLETGPAPTNSCFRVDPIMNSIVADKRGGDFADDLYVVLVDNRNGTIRNSNNDAFFYKSTDGGVTWIGPTRVNDDPSSMPANRDCGRNPNSIRGNSAGCPAAGTGNDQFFPWVTITSRGDLNVTFHDRRLDTFTGVGEGAWPTSKTTAGNYLVWFWGAHCDITQTAAVSGGTSIPSGAAQCVAPEAVVNPTATTGLESRPRTGSRQHAVDVPVPELPDLEHGLELRLLVSSRALRRGLHRPLDRPDRSHRPVEHDPSRGALDGRPKRARLGDAGDDAGRPESGLRAVGRVLRPAQRKRQQRQPGQGDTQRQPVHRDAVPD